MLLKNKRIRYDTPWNQFGGVLINERNNFYKTYANRFISEDGGTYDKRASIPLGTEAIYSYLLAVKGGGMVSHTIEGDSSGTGAQSNGINVVSNITGEGQMLVSISLVISMLSSITGDWQMTASLSMLIKMATDMAGSGQMTGALSLLAGIIGVLSGSVSISATLRGTQTMASDITPFTELSPQNLSQSVWEYATRTLTSGGGGGGWATPEEIWEYATRTLTESAGLTPEQDEKLDSIYTNADAKTSNINVRPIGYDGGKLDAIYKAIKEIKEVDEEGILKEIRESIPEEVDLSPVLQRLKNLDKIESSVNSIVKMEEEKKKKHEQEEEEKEQEEKEENDEIEEALELVDKEIENSILETIKEVEKEHENAIKEAIKNLKNGN